MAEAARRPHYSLEEYLRLEERSNVRHEFFDGEIFAMAGGTLEHSGIAANLIVLLGSRLAGRPCRVFTSDARVRVAATGLVTYPDVSVVCGSVEHDEGDANTLVNPVFLAEVTSPNTEDYDRGAKLENYKRIASLKEVLIVSHAAPQAEVWRRVVDDTWVSETYGPGSEVRLASLAVSLPIEAIYRNPLAP